MELLPWFLVSCLIGLATGWLLLRWTRSHSRLPPGPISLPLIGTLELSSLSTTKSPLWMKLKDWQQTYGPLVTVYVGNNPIVFLGSRSVMRDLFEKRGRIYSSRPRLVMASEIMSHDDHIVVMPYGPSWRKQHRIQGTLLNQQAVRHYRRLLDLESLISLRDILSQRDEPGKAFLRYIGSILNTLAYGEPTADHHDAPQLREVEDIARAFADATGTGVWLVDRLPLLKRLPDWIAPWNRFGGRYHERAVELFRAKTLAAESAQGWNWVKHAKQVARDEMSEHELFYVIGALYQAAVHVTVSSLRRFWFVCFRFPDAVNAAQDELDRVVGPDRLPGIEDVESLPYVVAFIKELLRWRTLAPLGVPRVSIESDTYQGYEFPRGTTFITNNWALEMDELDGDDPWEFRPERWLQSNPPTVNVFGFGRRVCPGQHLAQEAVFLLISRILSVMSFHTPQDLTDLEFEMDATVLAPKAFAAVVAIRDEKREQTLHQAWENVDREVSRILEQIGKEMT